MTPEERMLKGKNHRTWYSEGGNTIQKVCVILKSKILKASKLQPVQKLCNVFNIACIMQAWYVVPMTISSNLRFPTSTIGQMYKFCSKTPSGCELLTHGSKLYQ